MRTQMRSSHAGAHTRMAWRVAVVGAGAAGLCCARYLRTHADRFTFSVFEKANKIGGTWVYTDRKDLDDYGLPVHSSMNAHLRTNLPKELMDFPDIPFNEELPSFIGHKDMLDYLQDFATRFNLYENIQFHTHVEKVEPVSKDSLGEGATVGEVQGVNDSVKWMVETRDLENGTISKEIYDFVLVCNGHYSKPYIPEEIPHLDNFPGSVTHSHVFRRADPYTARRVLIVGPRASGSDILVHVSPVAHSVCLVYHTSPALYKLPPNAEQHPCIAGIDTDGTVHFVNGESRVVDDIILCTGYQYSFPFLSSDSGVTVEAGKRVKHLYKHTFNIEHPSMVFIGLNYPVVPFPFFDVQVRFILSVLTGQTQLPPREDMMANCKADYTSRLRQGIPFKHTHRLANQFSFINELIEVAGLVPHPPKYEKLNQITFESRKLDVLNFRKYEYRVSERNDGEVDITRHLHSRETLV